MRFLRVLSAALVGLLLLGMGMAPARGAPRVRPSEGASALGGVLDEAPAPADGVVGDMADRLRSLEEVLRQVEDDPGWGHLGDEVTRLADASAQALDWLEDTSDIQREGMTAFVDQQITGLLAAAIDLSRQLEGVEKFDLVATAEALIALGEQTAADVRWRVDRSEGVMPTCAPKDPAHLSGTVLDDDGRSVTLDVLVLLDRVPLAAAEELAALAGSSYRPLGITVRWEYVAVDFPARRYGWEIHNDAIAWVGGARPEGVDVVHVLTTQPVRGSDTQDILGEAYCIGGVAWDDRAFSMSKFGTTSGRWLEAMAISHEIGHLLGATHERANCAEGVDPERTSPGDFEPAIPPSPPVAVGDGRVDLHNPHVGTVTYPQTPPPCTVMFPVALGRSMGNELHGFAFSTPNARFVRAYGFLHA